MDELKMDGIELPDTGESYDDLPDASEGLLEDNSRPSFAMGGPEDFSDIPMPVLSEMDGSEIAAPAKQESKPVSLDKPDTPKPMFEDMSAPTRPQNTQQTSSSGQSTYQSTSGSYQSTSGSYQSTYQGTSNPRVSSSMDDLYAARRAVDPEKYEKGRKKTKIVAGVGIALYGYNTLSYLLSLIGGGGLSVLLDLGIAGFLLYMFIRFFIGSNTAKETLAWWIGIDVVFNIIGIVTAGVATAAFSSFGLGGIFGFLAIMGIISLVARCVMLYFLILDEDITEYSKNKQ